MIRAALFLALMLSPFAGWSEGLDEETIRSDPPGTVDRLLDRAGFRKIERSFALVLGIHNFDEFSDLPTARDPIRIRDYLVNEAGFDHVHLLTGDKVTRARLQELMIDEFGAIVGPNDRFLFYWSGHGETLQRGGVERGFLPLGNSRRDRFSTMISMENISAWDDFIEARQVLYLMDSCFSGLIGAAPQSDLAEITRAQLSGPSRHVITAGRADEQTIAVDALGGSVFTHALLKGLRGGADKFEDGLVSVGELKSYLGIEVTRLRERYGWEKSITPQLRDLRGSDGAFFFPIPAAFAPAQETVRPEGDPLAEAQQALADLGYDAGPPTGVMSLKTRTALILFQRRQGLAETGALDAATLNALPFALAAMVQPQGQAGPETSFAIGAAQSLAPPPDTAENSLQPSAVTIQPCEQCPELIRVEGGTMAYGPRAVDERPPSITVDVAPFFIATTETTISQFNHFREASGYDGSFSGPRCFGWIEGDRMVQNVSPLHEFVKASVMEDESTPAFCTSREDALAYFEWLNADNPGPPYRLPTEAEFELLLERGLAETRAHASGKAEAELTCMHGNFGDASSQFSWRNIACQDGYPKIAPARSFPAASPGVYDLAGNLWEWVADCWRENLSLPLQTEVCRTGTVKGGSFDDPVKNTAPDARQPVPANRRQINIGFRIARDID